ncbi:MAG: UDP-N-acetylmuramoyl-L-alanyl-D-glutamate--2,6-diaminopimelate ligase [Phycisphaerales bacterium]|nr:MAG: UDP-N-acetylmuramoyl-L-alanyl-D-glutamate--2,6-diaminopimelate ligase [Phycisphaerales bacterium]
MMLDALIRGLDVRTQRGRAEGVRICDVTDDSRTVMPGSLFIARKGLRFDGRAHIAEALRAGAAAVLIDARDGEPPAGFPSEPGAPPLLVTEDALLASARIAERFYADPSSRLRLVGVTGTNGKTTTCWLIHHLLRSCGHKPGLISTVGIDDGCARAGAVMTTPPAIELSRTLGVMVEAGCDSAVIETSSHALDQCRVAALRFEVGVFTNLTGDHLDYHRSMDDYAAAKARLFASLPETGVAIINGEDEAGARMVRDCRARTLACVFEGADTSLPGERCEVAIDSRGAAGADVRVSGPWGVIESRLPLVGRHNAMNALQAVAAAHALGAPADRLAIALASATSPPGRLEPVTREHDRAEPFTVLVDYAHTDDALQRSLLAARPLVGDGGRLIVVFGCGGDRDRSKRPRMGAAAAAGADVLVLTSDNPRTEDPGAIIRGVLEGVPAEARDRLHIHSDRERAIAFGVQEARAGDVVLIAGKGHEDYQLLPDGAGGIVRRDFDDRSVARSALRQRFDEGSPHGAADPSPATTAARNGAEA